MKRFSSVTVVVVVMLLFGLLLPGSAADLKTKDGFMSAVKSAFSKKDKTKLLSLFCWDGVSKGERPSREEQIDAWFEDEIKKVDFEALPENFTEELIVNGERIKFNLPPEGGVAMTFPFPDEGNYIISLPFGRKDGQYYFATRIKEKVDSSVPSDEPLYISIDVGGSEKPVKFRCDYSYVVAGKEKNISFEDSTSVNIGFFGRYIKKCVVQKISNNGWIELDISDGERKKIFSGKQTTNKPIVYKKP